MGAYQIMLKSYPTLHVNKQIYKLIQYLIFTIVMIHIDITQGITLRIKPVHNPGAFWVKNSQDITAMLSFVVFIQKYNLHSEMSQWWKTLNTQMFTMAQPTPVTHGAAITW